MKLKTLFRTLCLMLFLISVTQVGFSQCDLVYLDQDFDCDDGGTPADPSDDTFTVDVLGHDNVADDFFTVTAGPFSVNSPPATVTVASPFDPSCLLVVTLVDPPLDCIPFVCPLWDVCYTLIDQQTCSATYGMTITGNLAGFTLSNLNLTFSLSSGQIESIVFTPGSALAAGGAMVSGSGSAVVGGSNIDGGLVNGHQFEITITANPGQCITLSNSLMGMFIDDNACLASILCSSGGVQFCAGGNQVGGLVTTFNNALSPCPETQGLSVVGAEVSITTASGENCQDVTDDNGQYGCVFCDDGPYEVCVTSECPEPCGLTSLDIVLLQQIILGITPWLPEYMYFGDVNLSGTVSGIDLITMRKWLLGIPVNITNWCRFVPVPEYTSSNTAAVDNCITLNGPGGNVDFIRFMLGDLNGSCDDCTHGDGIGPIPIVIGDDGASKSMISLPLNEKIHALTLSLYVGNAANVMNVSSPLSGAEYSIDNGVMTWIWFDESARGDGVQLSSTTDVLSIDFLGSAAATLIPGDNYVLTGQSGIYELTSAGGGGRKTADITTLKIEGLTHMNLVAGSPEVSIELYDLLGKQLFQEVHTLSNGSVSFDRSQFPQGVYILRVKNAENDITQKMFLK